MIAEMPEAVNVQLPGPSVHVYDEMGMAIEKCPVSVIVARGKLN